jgi:hypothetical protein
MENLNINLIVGLKVLEVRGFLYDKRKIQRVEPEYILFDNRMTYMRLEEQDCFTYHDCSSSARHIYIIQNVDEWKRIYEDKKRYPLATVDL